MLLGRCVLTPDCPIALKLTALAALVLIGDASAQIMLWANTPNTNGLTVGTPALLFDLTASANDITITSLATGSDRLPDVTFDLEIWTHAGSCLGGPVGTGPGSSAIGWTRQGVVTATQGPWHGRSLPIDIPDIFVPRLQTVGVALVYVQGGARYTGTGTAGPQVFADSNLTLTTGESRSKPFTTEGTWFPSRALQGQVTYSIGGVGIGNSYCSPAVPNSTSNSGTIRGIGSALVTGNNLTLVAENLPNGAFGFFLTSRTQGVLAQPGGSVGVLCVLGSIGRYVGPGQVWSSGTTGRFHLRIDLTRTPTPMGLVGIATGETWNFTTWYRDAVGGVTTSNFTNAMAVNFQ